MRPVEAERPTWDCAMELQRGGPGTAAKLIMNDCDCCLAMPGDCPSDCCLNGDGGGPSPLQRGVRPGVGAGPCGLAGKGLGLGVDPGHLGVVPGLRLLKGLGRGLAVFGSLRLVSGVSQRFFALEECIGVACNLLKVSRRPRPELPKPSFPEPFGRGD